MIQVTPMMRILVAVEPSDFRKGIDGLAQVCKSELARDPFSGTVFVFRNRRATAIKRLSRGRFRWWPRSRGVTKMLEAHELQVLVSGGNPLAAQGAPTWRRVNVEMGT